MSAITNCPACHTQFVVTDEQLNQHGGKVRCGQCLHVFNAINELVDAVETTDVTEATPANTDEAIAIEALPAPSTEINESFMASTFNDAANSEADDIVNDALIKDRQDSYFNAVENKSKTKSAVITWLLALFILVLLLTAMAQSIYFLRTKIATYYPNTKAYLVQACAKIGCSIDLPKHIDLIVIDDSDMQEDADYIGLIHLSSTLINQANFVQAYPKIELTLTDIDDTAKLRRIFNPNEYLPNNTNIAKGLAAGESIKIKLAITANDVAVAGYRVFVSY